MNRVWDPQEKYKDGFLKEYNHWIIEVSFRQHTIGCYIIFAKRNVERISELNKDELSELSKAMGEIENTLIQISEFKPDRFNYLQLGNELHRLHFHGIPRYKTQRNFGGEIWTDKTWGHPPTWSNSEVSKEFVLKIKEKILEYLPK